MTTLNWKTVINTTEVLGEKTAKTHFGTVYTLRKAYVAGTWKALVTVPGHSGIKAQTETLVEGVTFAAARKAAIDDFIRNGGR